MVKTCLICKNSKELNNYSKSGKYYSSYCKQCQATLAQNKRNELNKNKLKPKEGFKFCFICHEEKLINEYQEYKTRFGNISTRNVCHLCRQNQKKISYKNIPKKRKLWYKLTERCKLENIKLEITYEDMPEIPEYCPVFPWIKLKLDNNVMSDDSPSCDRIDNTKGYIINNIQIISMRANRLKNDGTLQEHKALYEYLEKILLNDSS